MGSEEGLDLGLGLGSSRRVWVVVRHLGSRCRVWIVGVGFG